MNKSDISKEYFVIKKIENIIKSEMNSQYKTLYINGRHSDAFVYIISGYCDYEFDDGTAFSAKPGDILYLANKSVYNMCVQTISYKFIFCDFEFDNLSMKKSMLFSPEDISSAENLFIRLHKFHLQSASNTFFECMAILYKIYGILFFISNRTYMGNLIKQKITDSKIYIDLNIQNPDLSVSALAQRINMSEVYFRKCFKSAFGTTPSQYMISARLNKVNELMKYPFLNLGECALQSGFSSLQYFYRVFKRNTGDTPSKYRKKAYNH